MLSVPSVHTDTGGYVIMAVSSVKLCHSAHRNRNTHTRFVYRHISVFSIPAFKFVSRDTHLQGADVGQSFGQLDDVVVAHI